MAALGSYPLIIVGCLIILLSFIFTKIANRTNVPAVSNAYWFRGYLFSTV